MAGADDRVPVITSEAEYLRRFVAARDAGDESGTRHAWGVLVQLSHDRIAGFIHVAAIGKLRSDDEIEEARQRAFIRHWEGLCNSFKGSSMGEYVMATKQLCVFAVLDVQRAASIRSKRNTSIDRVVDDGEGGTRPALDPALAGEAARRAQEAAELREAAALLDQYIPQVSNERYRVVLRRTVEGAPAEEIAKELDVSMANLYQLRTRGINAVRTLVKGDES